MRFADQVNTLLELQALDLEIDTMKEKKRELPARADEAKEGVIAREKELDEAKDQLKHLEMERKKAELEVESVREETVKLETQMLSVKTNREYQALQKEIDEHKERIVDEEDVVLEVMEQMEAIEERVAEKMAELAKAQEIVKEKVAEAKAGLAEIETSLAKREARRDGLASDLSKPLLTRYEKVRKSRKGIGIAKLEEEICSGCHMDLRPQLVNEVKMGDKIVTCETCYRILYCDY